MYVKWLSLPASILTSNLFLLILTFLPTHCGCRGLLVHLITLRHTTLGRTPLDEVSALRRDFYLITRNTHKRQTAMPPAIFEPAIPASIRPQTNALDRAAAGICLKSHIRFYSLMFFLIKLLAI
jgi:hypothetical protein